MTDLTPAAISAALCCDWKKAIEINIQIIKETGENIDCLNRLGRAYLEMGENKKAALCFKKVLKIDKYDSIANRNLARSQQAPVAKRAQSSAISPSLNSVAMSFLEEPGKTKLVALVNLAPARVLLKQKQADTVLLVPKRHTIVATDQEGNYLGSLPDDLGHRLSLLMKGGNHYCAVTKSVTQNSIVIFIRELLRAKRFTDTPSFITNSGDYFSFVREDVPGEATHAEAEAEDEGTISEKLHQDEEPEST